VKSLAIDNEIATGIQLLFKNDAYLLEIASSERSITHRLGMYYQIIFSEWHVDCEYNKNLGGQKMIEIDPKMFLNKMADILEEESLSQYSELLRQGSIQPDDLISLREQLRKSKIEIDHEFDVIYFLLRETNGKTVKKLIYPDIIVHERSRSNNFVVIEVKKSNNIGRLSAAYDLVKLFTLITDPSYGYRHGYFINIPVLRDFDRHKKIIFTPVRLHQQIHVVEFSS